MRAENQTSGADAGLATMLPRIQAARGAVLAELQKVIVGQRAPMEQLLTAMFARGHCLIQGPLASAKTVLVASACRWSSAASSSPRT